MQTISTQFLYLSQPRGGIAAASFGFLGWQKQRKTHNCGLRSGQPEESIRKLAKLFECQDISEYVVIDVNSLLLLRIAMAC